jgi:hypothetical protein
MKTKINNISFGLLLEKIGKLEEQMKLLKSELKHVGVICNNLCERNEDSLPEMKKDD